MSKRAPIFCALAIAAFCAGASTVNVLGSAKNVVIKSEVTRTRLPISGDALRSKTELVLRNVRFDVHPGTQFHVILERRDDRTQRARVGTLSFYASVSMTTRTFDVTDELRKIADTAAELAKVDVVFEATTGRGGAGSRSTFDPKSKLTIGAVELRIKSVH